MYSKQNNFHWGRFGLNVFIKTFSVVFIVVISQISCFSQQGKSVRGLIDTLCSENLHGRAYSFSGDKLTADFIAGKLKKYGLKFYEKTFFQEFKLSVNVFEGANSLSFSDKKLIPGVDYLIGAESGTLKGEFPVLFLNKEILNDSLKFHAFIKRDFSDSFIAVDTVGSIHKDHTNMYDFLVKYNALKAKGIIIPSENKLMYSPGGSENNFVSLILTREKFNFLPERISVNIENKFLPNYKTQNVIGYLKGEVDSSIVFSCHYEHLGNMGKDMYFPGANDNASGIAMVLSLAKYYSSLKKKPKYNIVFMFFAGEELGLLGSKYYTENPLFPLKEIKFLINLDMVGSGDKGIQVVNGSVFKDEFDKLVQINKEKEYLVNIKIRGAAANSDHYFFYEKGVKSFFIYTLGEYKEYHNISDNPTLLPLVEFDDLFQLLLDFEESF